mmetsp:Transcript_12523/g.14172  ORF Transcript_12523/g.14172 Transcript_12523/m.14172 type:complete len:349 (-) Transcript_12523:22-1068(-)
MRCQWCPYLSSQYVRICVLPVLVAMLVALLFRGRSQEWGRNGWGGVPRTLEEELATCPVWITWFLRDVKIHPAIKAYQMVAATTSSQAGESAFHPEWADDYVISFWLSGVQMLIGFYSPRHADTVRIPSTSADPPSFRVGRVVSPDRDIDDPIYWPIENYIPRFFWNTMFLPVFACYQGILREFDMRDNIESNWTNTWGTLILKGKSQRKSDWMMSYFDTHTQMDGKSPSYPHPVNAFADLFLKADEWDDGLEKAMAFDLLGAHKVVVVENAPTIGGESLPFLLSTNAFSEIEVRPHFGKYGADMYFTAEGLPALIQTPDGRQVLRGDKDWQYWKFVWRSTPYSESYY